jgi:nickel transport protein
MKLNRLLVFATLLPVTPALSHEIWFAQRSAQLALIYGTGAEDLDTVKRLPKIVSVGGFDATGKPVDVSYKATDSLVVVNVENKPAIVTGILDNGLWSKTPGGEWIAKGKDEVTNAVISGHNYKYATYLRELPKGAGVAVTGLKLQLVAVGKTFPTKAGEKLTVQVLFDGKPLAAARVFREMVTEPDGKPTLTNENGIATLTVRNQGLNVVMAMHVAAPEDPARTFMTEHVATLGFAYPPPAE